MVTINVNKPVMLIDTSYFIFYRYFAVYNWFKLAQKTLVDVPTILSNHVFMNKFDKLFEENLERLRKKNKIDYDNIVFAKDCMREHIWRYEFFADYKRSREERLTTFNGDIFKYCYNTLLPKLEAKLGIQSCEHACSEADDIIAVFARHIHATNPDVNITIVTNDNDYLQLIRKHVYLVNMKNIDLNTRVAETSSPEMYLKTKIILGDKSDNIPSIFPKCGEKKAQQLAENPDLLEERLNKCEETRRRYELNTLLIDTLKIPGNIQDEIRSMMVLT